MGIRVIRVDLYGPVEALDGLLLLEVVLQDAAQVVRGHPVVAVQAHSLLVGSAPMTVQPSQVRSWKGVSRKGREITKKFRSKKMCGMYAQGPTPDPMSGQ